MSRLSRMVKQRLARVLCKQGCCLSSLLRINFFEPLLYSHLANRGRLFFVQIGANDGKTSDPVYQFVSLNHNKVRGIVVEPLGDFFKQLKNSYAKYPNVIPVNAAIHHSEREMTLYRVDPARLKDLPQWAKGIASFNKNHHELSGIPHDAIVPEKVRCMTLSELLTDHQATEIDLLQIDTEGYDSEIIRNIDFQAVKPKIIRFEHGLSEGIMSHETFLDIIDLLHANDYELVIEYHDATAYQRDILTER